MLLSSSPARPEPFNTNINTNYNNNYNSNWHTSYLISSLLNYILNLLQILQKNCQANGSDHSNIPVFPQPDEFRSILRQYPPTDLQPSFKSSTGEKSIDSPPFKGDFNALYDFVFDHLIKNQNKTGKNKENGSYLEGSPDNSETLVPYDYKRAVESAVEAFKGPVVPPPLPTSVVWDIPQQVPDPPELQAAKMEFLRAFAEAQARAAKPVV